MSEFPVNSQPHSCWNNLVQDEISALISEMGLQRDGWLEELLVLVGSHPCSERALWDTVQTLEAAIVPLN